MKRFKLLLSLALIALPLSIQAAPRSAARSAAPAPRLSYSFIDARYIFVEGQDDTGNIDSEGYGVGASFLVNPNVFLFGSYADVELDENCCVEAETTTIAGGAGVRHGISPSVDLFATAAAVNADVEASGSFQGNFFSGSDDDTGFALDGGVRALLGPVLEIAGAVTYIDIFDEDETDFVGSVLLHLGRSGFSIGADYAIDAEALAVGGRFNF